MQTSPGTLTNIATSSVARLDGVILTADLNGDGAAELVMRGSVARLVGGTWTSSSVPIALDGLCALFDWNGDGLLDMVGAWQGNQVGYLPGARADLSIIATNAPATVAAGTSMSVEFAITNNGPSVVNGIALSVSPSSARITSDTCPSSGCEGLQIASGATIKATAIVTAPGTQTAVTASVCSELFDQRSDNNTTTVNVAVSPQADLEIECGMQVQDSGMTILVQAGNNGPSTATNARFEMQIPSEGMVANWQSTPTGASCTMAPGRLSCSLPRLDASAGWTVTGTGTLAYHGQALKISATITSDTPDPKSSNNTFEMSLPALGTGLPNVPGSSGCGCHIGSRGHAMPVPMLAILGILFFRRKR